MTDQDPTQHSRRRRRQTRPPPAAPPPAPEAAPRPCRRPRPRPPTPVPPPAARSRRRPRSRPPTRRPGDERRRPRRRPSSPPRSPSPVAAWSSGSPPSSSSRSSRAARSRPRRCSPAASGTPDVLAWTPADSVTYVEARLDLPGDQQASSPRSCSAFPGFDDQAAFPTKLNEVLDQLVGKASDGKQSYTADIAPWFGGQLAREPRRPPDERATRRPPGSSPSRASRTRRRPSAWAASTLQTAGATSTTETYNGVTINVIQPGAERGAMADKVKRGLRGRRPGPRDR